MPSQPKPTGIDLFAGGGGLSSGFVGAGFALEVAADNSSAAVATHRPNLDGDARHVDLGMADFEIPPVTVIAGARPVKAFHLLDGANMALPAIRSLVGSPDSSLGFCLRCSCSRTWRDSSPRNAGYRASGAVDSGRLLYSLSENQCGQLRGPAAPQTGNRDRSARMGAPVSKTDPFSARRTGVSLGRISSSSRPGSRRGARRSSTALQDGSGGVRGSLLPSLARFGSCEGPRAASRADDEAPA